MDEGTGCNGIGARASSDFEDVKLAEGLSRHVEGRGDAGTSLGLNTVNVKKIARLLDSLENDVKAVGTQFP